MSTTPIPYPPNEAERVVALHSLHLLYTPPEERFERLVNLTRQHFAVPIALISLVDTKRVWFKACEGLTVSESPRDVTFCSYTILQDSAFVVPDMQLDERFVQNPYVAGIPFIRFYAGYPLRGPQGHRLGALCIMDLVPRQLTALQLQFLQDIARLVEREVNATISRKSQKAL